MKTLKTIGTVLFWTLIITAIYLLLNVKHFFKTTYEDVKVLDAFTETKILRTEKLFAKTRYMAFIELKDGSTMELKNVKSRLSIDFKWSAATLQSKLAKAKADNTPCTITAYGWRIPWLGMYPNIVEVTFEGEAAKK